MPLLTVPPVSVGQVTVSLHWRALPVSVETDFRCISVFVGIVPLSLPLRTTSVWIHYWWRSIEFSLLFRSGLCPCPYTAGVEVFEATSCVIVALLVLSRIIYLGGVLQVYNVTDTDSGTYVCQALIDSNSNTDIPQKRASLSVIPGKMFKVSEGEISVSNIVRCF